MSDVSVTRSSLRCATRRSRPLIADLLRLLVLTLPAFTLLLGLRPLSVPDEGRYPEIAREMLLSGNFITPKINGIVFLDKPVLYYWLESLSFHLFGVSPWSARLMPALFGVAGVVIVFVTARRLFSRCAAWWSALVLATNPLYFLSSQYADMNIEVAVLISAVLCFFLLGRAAEPGASQRRWFWAAWAAIGLAVLTKGLIGFVFPAMIIGVWTVVEWRWRELPRWRFGSGLAIALLLCLPWYLLVQGENPQFFQHFFIFQQFQRFTGTGFNNVQPLWFYPAVIALGLLPWSLWLPLALRRQLAALRARAADVSLRKLLLLWPLLVLVFFSIPSSKIVGYILPVLPPLALLLGEFLAQHRDFSEVQSVGAARVRRRREWLLSRRRSVLMPLIGIVICIGAIVAAKDFDRSGIAPLAADLKQWAQPQDRIVSYRSYYQDLPMYLQTREPLLVVDDWSDERIMDEDNWRREFAIGLRDQPEAHNWLLDEKRFADLLAGPQRVFVLARARDVDELTQRYALQIADRTGKTVLLTSRPL